MHSIFSIGRLFIGCWNLTVILHYKWCTCLRLWKSCLRDRRNIYNDHSIAFKIFGGDGLIFNFVFELIHNNNYRLRVCVIIRGRVCSDIYFLLFSLLLIYLVFLDFLLLLFGLDLEYCISKLLFSLDKVLPLHIYTIAHAIVLFCTSL